MEDGVGKNSNYLKYFFHFDKGKEVATKYFLPGHLKLNLFWLGFPNY